MLLTIGVSGGSPRYRCARACDLRERIKGLIVEELLPSGVRLPAEAGAAAGHPARGADPGA